MLYNIVEIVANGGLHHLLMLLEQNVSCISCIGRYAPRTLTAGIFIQGI